MQVEILNFVKRISYCLERFNTPKCSYLKDYINHILARRYLYLMFQKNGNTQPGVITDQHYKVGSRIFPWGFTPWNGYVL